MGGPGLPWAAAVPTTLACRLILAFGFRCYNHKHQLQVGRYTTWQSQEERKRVLRSRWCKGWDSNPRFPNYQFGALPTWPPLHMVVLFICPRKHQTRVCKFYLYPTYRKVLALRLIELTCSIYIPYPAFGWCSVLDVKLLSRLHCTILSRPL